MTVKHIGLMVGNSQDRVAVVSFAGEEEIGSVGVGRHPQRVRPGKMYLGGAGSVSR